MNIWILEGNSGVTLLFKSFTGFELNEYLVSGFITALNQFTIAEFKRPIESINMGGYKWIYILDEELNLLFVVADSKASNEELLRARLTVIKQSFINKFVTEEKIWGDVFDGNIEPYECFKKTIEDYYNQWEQAEDLNNLAEFFDFLGVFQQLLNLINNIIEKHLFYDVKLAMWEQIENLFFDFLSSPEIITNPELSKVSYNRGMGFDIISINPSNCDFIDVEKHIIILFNKIATVLKDDIGFEGALILFSKEKIIEYIYNNLEFLKKLNLANYMFQIFLLDLREENKLY